MTGGNQEIGFPAKITARKSDAESAKAWLARRRERHGKQRRVCHGYFYSILLRFWRGRLHQAQGAPAAHAGQTRPHDRQL